MGCERSLTHTLCSPSPFDLSHRLLSLFVSAVLCYYGIVLLIPIYFKDEGKGGREPAPCGTDNKEFTAALVNACAGTIPTPFSGILTPCNPHFAPPQQSFPE